MKLIVFTVISTVVVKAACREPPDGREFSHDGHKLPYIDAYNVGDNSKGGSFTNYLNLSNSIDVSNGPDVFNETSTMIQGPFSDESVGLLFTDIDVEAVQRERKLRGGSKCKSDIVCSLVGGSCIANSTYCNGREVSSLCSGAKCKCCIIVKLEVKVHDLETQLQSMVVNLTDANSKLNTKLDSMRNLMLSANASQAIVNSNLDRKIDSVISTNSNLTIANSNLDRKIDSVMSTNSNLSIANSNLDQKIDSVISTNSNLTLANSNLDRKINSIVSSKILRKINSIISSNTNQDQKINSIISSNSKLSIAISNLDRKINSIVSSNSNLDRKINSIISSNTNQEQKINSIISSNSKLSIANTNQNSKLDSIRKHQGCPDGLFLFTPSNQCFRMLMDTRRNWHQAKSACSSLGLELAMPYDPIGLRSYITTKFGHVLYPTWVGAQGDGRALTWKRSGKAITTKNPYWWPGRPNTYVSTSACLELLTREYNLNDHPTKPYYNGACSSAWWTLCEKVI